MATFTEPLFTISFILVSILATLAYLTTHIKLEEVPKGRFLERGILYGLTIGLILALLFMVNSIIVNEGWNADIFDWFQGFNNTYFWALFAVLASYFLYIAEKTAFWQEIKENRKNKKQRDGEDDE